MPFNVTHTTKVPVLLLSETAGTHPVYAPPCGVLDQRIATNDFGCYRAA